MSDQLFDKAVRDWLEDGSDRTPPAAIDAVLLAAKTTPQERDFRIPWRFPPMTNSMRAAGMIATIAILAVGILAFNSMSPGFGTSSPGPSMTAAPTAIPSSTPVAPGITAWATYSSTIYPRLDLKYPVDWSVEAPATRTWHVGDAFPPESQGYAETFVSPGSEDDQIGLVVWEMPHEGDGGPDSFERLKVWAETFCSDVLALTTCADFTKQAIPMCHRLEDGCDAGDGAILVPTAGEQYAFFRTWQSELSDSTTVRVVVIARPDSFPAAARYGGSIQLLKSILSTMDVWVPGQQPSS